MGVVTDGWFPLQDRGVEEHRQRGWLPRSQRRRVVPRAQPLVPSDEGLIFIVGGVAMGTKLRTYEEINEKIKKGQVVVVTAEEVVDLVREKGVERVAREVDVVTTGTFGIMCSSGAFLNIGHTKPRMKIHEAYLNGVMANETPIVRNKEFLNHFDTHHQSPLGPQVISYFGDIDIPLASLEKLFVQRIEEIDNFPQDKVNILRVFHKIDVGLFQTANSGIGVKG